MRRFLQHNASLFSAFSVSVCQFCGANFNFCVATFNLCEHSGLLSFHSFPFQRAVFFESGCKDKQLYIAAKSFLKVLINNRVKHSTGNGFNEKIFFGDFFSETNGDD